VRMTLSNANSLDYFNLYGPQEPKFHPAGFDLPLRGMAGPTVANDSARRKSPAFARKLYSIEM